MNELMEKIIAELNANGVELKLTKQNFFSSYDHETMYNTVGAKYIELDEVNRHNGTEKNVTAEISVYVMEELHSCKRIDKVRVNENASDRVVKNRVKKIMEIYK